MAEPSSDDAPQTQAPASRPLRSRLTLGLGVAMGLVILSNLVFLSSFAGMVAVGSGQAVAVLAAVAVLGLVFALPMGGGALFTRFLAGRGYKVRRLRTVIGITLAWNVLLCGGVVFRSEGPVQMVRDHGAWLPLTLLGRDVAPGGLRGVPAVREYLAQLMVARSLTEVAPLLTEQSAADLAKAWMVELDGRSPGVWRGDETLEARFAELLEAHARARTTGEPAPHARLRGVAELLDALLVSAADTATWDWGVVSRGLEVPSGPLAADVADGFEVRVVDDETLRVALSDNLSIQARVEGGRWRLDLGDLATVPSARLARLAEAPPPEVSEAVEPTADEPVQATGDTDEPADHVAVRDALRRAAAGHAGHLALTTAHDAGWPDALTREAAASTGLALLGWCAADAAEGSILATEAATVRTRYALSDATVAADVEARGRGFLADVLAVCAPVLRERQQAWSTPAGEVPDARRARWARLDAEDLAERAVIVDVDLGRKTVRVDGKALAAVDEDGAWRIAWD